MPVEQAVLDEIALSAAEYDLIVERLGREPNPVELGMFGALWSEHCGYKHSKPLLKLLPGSSRRTLSQSGAENAGAVDIGDGLAVVFKVESHNHPSAVEPRQGAATGVGGIVRDILAMGARPIALLNSLRFGPPDAARNRYLFQGVVEGISWYGNCIGVPDVGGEIYFDQSYSQNPLVNAMCVGIVPINQLASAAADTAGSVLLLVGADTGRDGIHGASGLASRTLEPEQELRPTVQVGNPFLEKILIEACLEALATGGVSGIQDLGAAGLTSAAIESAYRGGRGISLDLSQVHRREPDMSPYETLLSESQERMLLVTPPEEVERVSRVFEKWDIPCRQIGEVLPEPQAHIRDGDQTIAQLPIKPLTEAPQYRYMGRRNPQFPQWRRLALTDIPLPEESPAQILTDLLVTPNIASKESVYRRYDYQVQTNTVVGPGSDAAVLRIKGTNKAIALCIDGNARYCRLHPHRGGQIAVAEVCRNLSCVGAEPLALTDCLNFGNPERLEAYFQLEWCIRGIALACRELGVPVVSGNVSLYNEAADDGSGNAAAILPTPIIGGLGLLENAARHTTAAFPEEGLSVFLLGMDFLWTRMADLAGSEYLETLRGITGGRPVIDLDLERRVQQLCRRLVREGLVRAAHDCSDGGLAVALAESAILGGVGFQGGPALAQLPPRWDAALFGEKQSRIIVALPSERGPQLRRQAVEYDVPLMELGQTGGGRFRLGDYLDLPMSEIAAPWREGLAWAMAG